jgi:hypothetical protein
LTARPGGRRTGLRGPHRRRTSTGLHYYEEAPPGPHHPHHHPGDQERNLLIASIDELSPDDRRHVAALVESLRRKATDEQADG